MIRFHRRVQALTAVVMLLLLAAGEVEAKEGFGMIKKLVSLERRNPPQVLITGTRIKVVGSGINRDTEIPAEQIVFKLSSELVQSDRRLSLDTERPQTVIEVKVLEDNYATRQENRPGLRRVAVGKDSKGKMQYRQESVVLRFVVVDYRFSGSYTVSDRSSGRTLFADSIAVTFREDFHDGQGAPSHFDRQALAVQHMVSEIVHALTPTSETIRVMVPKGSFENIINLAEAGLWSRYSEAIEALPERPTPRDESYRRYSLGVAYEALGYGAEDTETTLRYLDRAAQHYNAALSLHPAEDFFTKPYEGSFVNALGRASVQALGEVTGRPTGQLRERRAMAPLERVQTAMAKYQTLLAHDGALETAAAPAGAKSADGSAGAPPAGLSNGDVIAMVQGGVPEEIVVAAIDDADQCAFDTSPQGLIELAKGKVGAPIIRKIQDKRCG